VNAPVAGRIKTDAVPADNEADQQVSTGLPWVKPCGHSRRLCKNKGRLALQTVRESVARDSISRRGNQGHMTLNIMQKLGTHGPADLHAGINV
jgi:hypothetical protein